MEGRFRTVASAIAVGLMMILVTYSGMVPPANAGGLELRVTNYNLVSTTIEEGQIVKQYEVEVTNDGGSGTDLVGTYYKALTQDQIQLQENHNVFLETTELPSS